MAFYPGGRKGLAVSDPVDGKLRILSTSDRGQTWTVLSNAGMPASADEYGFAASGDCLVTAGKAAFLITGGAKSRVLRSDDRGLTWTAVESGIPAGPAAGGFAGAFASPRRGIAVGGDFGEKPVLEDNVAYTRDGRTWTGGITLTHVGEDVTYVRGWKVAVATGDYRGLGRHQPDPRRRRDVDPRQRPRLPRRRLRREGLLGRRQQGRVGRG